MKQVYSKKLTTTFIIILGASIVISCKKGPEPLPLPDEEVFSVPASYEFTDKDENSTVSFDGQIQRLDMLSEMVSYMKTANTAGIAVEADVLKAMYANDNYSWQDANGMGMTGSSKQMKNKTAYVTANGSADLGIQAMFESYMDSLAAISATTQDSLEEGTEGVGGVWPNDGIKGPYLMSGTGIEYAQWIEKGLMAAVFMNQMTVNYLGTISDDNNTTPIDGKNYTEMQHHWDEAYGYFTSAFDFPANGTDRFWGKYSMNVESSLGSAGKISLAFRTGRAAIDFDSLELVQIQVQVIRDEMEKVAAATAIHYLNEAKAYIANPTARNHVLSEATAFIDGMKYGYNSISLEGVSSSELDDILDMIGYDFNQVTINGIQNAIDALADKTGLTALKDSL